MCVNTYIHIHVTARVCAHICVMKILINGIRLGIYLNTYNKHRQTPNKRRTQIKSVLFLFIFLFC